MWIDNDIDAAAGTIGFRVETIDNNHGGRSRFSLTDRPLRTNQSHVSRLEGWCGETNNVSRFARGLVRVVRVNQTGERALVEALTGRELAAALEELGYPDLR